MNIIQLSMIESKFKFEKIIVWQKAMDYGEAINEITQLFPKEKNISQPKALTPYMKKHSI